MRTGLFSEQPESGKYTDFEARFLLTIWSSKVETTRVDMRAWQSQRLGMWANVGGTLKSTGSFKALMPFQNALGFQKVQAPLIYSETSAFKCIYHLCWDTATQTSVRSRFTVTTSLLCLISVSCWSSIFAALGQVNIRPRVRRSRPSS